MDEIFKLCSNEFVNVMNEIETIVGGWWYSLFTFHSLSLCIDCDDFQYLSSFSNLLGLWIVYFIRQMNSFLLISFYLFYPYHSVERFRINYILRRSFKFLLNGIRFHDCMFSIPFKTSRLEPSHISYRILLY